jgi:threonine/homoserine/homoserine lactone efflux protein
VVPAGHLLAFAALALIVIVIPGPSVTFVVGRALAEGRRAALLTVVGNTVGEYLQVLAVAFGVGALVERSVLAFTLIKLAGAGYVCFLGARALLRRRQDPPADAELSLARPAPTDRRSLGQGLLVGATNPKTIVFMVAVLPQFVARSSGDVAGQLLVLGAVFALIALASDSVWALAAGYARDWLWRSPRRRAAIDRAGGAAMLCAGAALAVTARRS